MSAGKSYILSTPTLLLYPNPQRDDSISIIPSDPFEFDESDLWSSSNSTQEIKKFPVPSSKRHIIKQMVGTAGSTRIPKPSAAASLPVNIPDWSKILGGDDHLRWSPRRDAEEGGDSDGDDDRECRVPPHEYLARTRRASLSVHEGMGRTLKGRDLRRVRNAIWEKTGFED